MGQLVAGLRVNAVALGALLVASAGVALANPAEAPSRMPEWCQAAAPAAHVARPLSSLAHTLRQKGALTVVAVGSSSTEGSDLPDPRLAFPTHTHSRLGALLGSGRVKLINRGRGGETVADTVARFERDVIAAKPDLVIWQLGANDIVRRLPVSEVRAQVSAGLRKLADAGATVLLMDSQLAPLIIGSPVRGEIDSMLREEGRKAGAAYWSRFAVMQAMIESGRARPEDLIRPDNLHMSIAMHQCTGTLLAEHIAAEVAPGGAQIVTAGR